MPTQRVEFRESRAFMLLCLGEIANIGGKLEILIPQDQLR